MKSKLKLIIGIYTLFNVIVACCPPVNKYVWHITDIEIHEILSEEFEYSYEFSASGETKLVDELSFLHALGPNKANAIVCCLDEDQYILQTQFTGVSVKSDGHFSKDEPAGDELKDHFKFHHEYDSELKPFEEIMNDRYGSNFFDAQFSFIGTLVDKSPYKSKLSFTFTFYLDTGDSIIVSSKEPISTY